jgi:hypothetical protein
VQRPATYREHVSVVLFTDVCRSFNLNSLEILAFNIIHMMLCCFKAAYCYIIFENLGTFCISLFVNPLEDHLKKLHIIEVLLLLPYPETYVGAKHMGLYMYCTYIL